MNKAQIVANELSKITASRMRAEIIAKNNIAKARENAEYLKLDTEMRKLKIALFKADDKESVDLRKKLYSIEEKAEKILAKLGLTKFDLLPQYSCKNCKDTGYVEGRTCECLKKLTQVALATQSGMNGMLRFSFETCDKKLLEENPVMEKAYKIAHKYVAEFPKFPYPNLVLMGDVGAGKTYLIECIASALIKKGVYVVFSTAYDLNETMQNSFGTTVMEREAILSPYFESDVLVIDDLGCEPMLRNITITNLFTILNERERLGLNTIISTNLNPAEIQERYGDRIMSRMLNRRTTLTIPLTGKDLRIIK